MTSRSLLIAYVVVKTRHAGRGLEAAAHADEWAQAQEIRQDEVVDETRAERQQQQVGLKGRRFIIDLVMEAPLRFSRMAAGVAMSMKRFFSACS